MIMHNQKKEKKMVKLPKPTSNEPKPAGTYKVQIKKYEHGASSVQKTPQITWTAGIIGGDYDGQSLWERNVMKETSAWRCSNLLGACGLIFPEGIDSDSAYFDLLCQSAIGRTCYWRVEEKTLESGKVVNEIKDYATDPDQEPIEVEDDNKAPAWIEKE